MAEMTTKMTKTHTAAKTVWEPTSRERTAGGRLRARLAENLSVKIKASKNGGGLEIENHYPDQAIGQVLLMDALGTADEVFSNGILSQLASAVSHGPEIDERGLNFMLSVIKGVLAKDQLETMLAAQMAAIHMASMTFARRLAHVEDIPHQDSAERAFTKLTRTFVKSNGSTQALPDRRRTEGHGATCSRQ